MEQETKNIEPQYIKIYVYPHGVFNVLDKSEILVYIQLMQMVDKNNIIKLDQDAKKEIMSSLGFSSLGTVSSALTSLKKVKVIASVDRGVYMFNPTYSALSTISSRAINKLIKKFNTLVNDTLL